MNCKCNAERAGARNLRKEEFHPTELLRLENQARFSSGNFKELSINAGSGMATAANQGLSFSSSAHGAIEQTGKVSCVRLRKTKIYC